MYIYVIDLETGNYDPDADNFSSENCMICEIGIAGLDTQTGEIEPIFNKTCRENAMCHPSSWIFRNTDLTFSDISGADHLSSIRSELQSILDGGIPVTSWGHDFDIRHLEHPTRNFRVPLRFWDPKKTLSDFLQLPGAYGFKWPRVQEAFNFFYPSLTYPEAHRALDDALAEADIIHQAINRWPTLEENWTSFI